MHILYSCKTTRRIWMISATQATVQERLHSTTPQRMRWREEWHFREWVNLEIKEWPIHKLPSTGMEKEGPLMEWKARDLPMIETSITNFISIVLRGQLRWWESSIRPHLSKLILMTKSIWNKSLSLHQLVSWITSRQMLIGILTTIQRFSRPNKMSEILQVNRMIDQSFQIRGRSLNLFHSTKLNPQCKTNSVLNLAMSLVLIWQLQRTTTFQICYHLTRNHIQPSQEFDPKIQRKRIVNMTQMPEKGERFMTSQAVTQNQKLTLMLIHLGWTQKWNCHMEGRQRQSTIQITRTQWWASPLIRSLCLLETKVNSLCPNHPDHWTLSNMEVARVRAVSYTHHPKLRTIIHLTLW